jgi:hypothetical protein
MSNRACLFAEDTPDAYNPMVEESDEGANTLFVAGAAYQIPVFWLCCFDEENFVDVDLGEDGTLSALVAPMADVRRRLSERHGRVIDLFPAHVAVWKQWRKVIESVDRRFLKLDPCEICILYEDPETLGGEMYEAMEWLDGSGIEAERESLLSLAGIENYDPATRTFSFDEKQECPEKFLFGWLEIEGA